MKKWSVWNCRYFYQLRSCVSSSTFGSPRRGNCSKSICKKCWRKDLNQTIALAKVGQTVWFAGAIGQDRLFLMHALEKQGVHTAYGHHIPPERIWGAWLSYSRTLTRRWGPILTLIHCSTAAGGFQYTNRTFHYRLVQAGMTQSVSCVAHCIDNGPMEGFWGITKRSVTTEIALPARTNLSRRLNIASAITTPGECCTSRVS